MITRQAKEIAYCFLHQKKQVYVHSNMDWQKDDIEMAVAEFVEHIDQQLYNFLANDKEDFLKNHQHFLEDINSALELLAN